MVRWLLLLAPAFVASDAVPRADDPAYTPTSAYERLDIRGFRVLVSPEATSHEGPFREARAELDRQLAEIVRVAPREALKALREVSLWIEWRAKPGGAAEFHPSAEWLRAHGYNPEKAGGIEVNNLENFVNWSRRTQPAMILHEMAHAYHHRVLGPDDARVVRAYEGARAGGRYDAVEHADGRARRKAYALTDRFEYFAELTEAYLARNDFEPFDRRALEAFDPEGYRLMREVWGPAP